MDEFQVEILKTKQRLGDALNACEEFGGVELVDVVTTAMNKVCKLWFVYKF